MRGQPTGLVSFCHRASHWPRSFVRVGGGLESDTDCGANILARGEMWRLVRVTGPAIIAIKCRVSTGAFVPGATSRSMRLLTAHPATRRACRFRGTAFVRRLSGDNGERQIQSTLGQPSLPRLGRDCSLIWARLRPKRILYAARHKIKGPAPNRSWHVERHRAKGCGLAG